MEGAAGTWGATEQTVSYIPYFMNVGCSASKERNGGRMRGRRHHCAGVGEVLGVLGNGNIKPSMRTNNMDLLGYEVQKGDRVV